MPRRQRSHSSRDPEATNRQPETESPGKSRASHAPQSRPRSTGLEPTASLEGDQTLVHLRFAAPSRLPHPRSPVVPPRHGVVRAACHPHPQLRDQAALSFTRPLRRPSGGVFHPARIQQRLVAHLLVHAEHDRALRRIQVEADDVADLLDEQRVLRELPGVLAVRLEPERPPDPRAPRSASARPRRPSNASTSASRPWASSPAS